jgi:hypothetical protein
VAYGALAPDATRSAIAEMSSSETARTGGGIDADGTKHPPVLESVMNFFSWSENNL